MSTAYPPVPATGTGLGYGIAIAVSVLVLISTIMLASYACIKANGISNTRHGNAIPRSGSSSNNNVGPNGSFVGNSRELAKVVVVGLDGPIIESYPKMVLGESRRLPRPNSGPCSICLCDYQAKDLVRCIPDCHHCFHTDCVDEWLKMSGTCPLCRNSPAPSNGPTPVTTPLSELVPLAFHARTITENIADALEVWKDCI